MVIFVRKGSRRKPGEACGDVISISNDSRAMVLCDGVSSCPCGARSAREGVNRILSMYESAKEHLWRMIEKDEASSVAALMGGALRLHPRIGVAEGKMSAGKKFRGRMDRVIRDYVADMQDELLAAKKEHVFITHSGCDEDTIAAVYGMLDGLHHFREIHVTRAGGVISSHCGPGTLGVLFIAGE